MTTATKREATMRQPKGPGSYTSVAQAVKPRPLYAPPTLAAVSQRPTAPTLETNKRARTVLLVSMAAVITIIVLASLQPGQVYIREAMSLVGNQAAVSAYLKSFGAWGPLVLALLHMVQVVVAFIPGHAFLVAAGYVYGLPLGLLLNLVTIAGASQMVFLLARWAGRPLASRMVPEEALDRWYRIGKKQGFTFFLIAFWLPVFPADMMNLVAGLSGISSRRFFAANLLGRIPGVLMLTLIGSHGLRFPPIAWAGMAAAGAAVFFTGRHFMVKIESQHSLPAAVSTD